MLQRSSRGCGSEWLAEQEVAAQEATSEQAAQLMREEAAGQRTALSADFEFRVRELSEEYERRTQVHVNEIASSPGSNAYCIFDTHAAGLRNQGLTDTRVLG